MGFENAESIFIDNKEVQSIVVKDSGGILFKKSYDITGLPIMTLTITGSSFQTSSTPFTYTGRVFVDWGDDTGLIEYTGSQLLHTFNDELNSHTVKVYGNITRITNLRERTNLTSITLPDSVTSFGTYCFYNCTNLTSITLSNSITSLTTQCFQNCTSLTSIILPDSITSIGPLCFKACSGFTQINIPDSVTSLGSDCFTNCIGLTSISFNWVGTDILTYNSKWIEGTSSSLKFKIPIGTTQLYIDKGYPAEKLEELEPMTLWAPELNGETGANYVHSYSESNGEAIGKGFIFKNGFDNINGWELSFEFKHDNIQYTGICFLTDLASGYKGREGSSTALTSWEGSWPGGSAYATYNSGTVGYFDVTVTKIDSTHVRLQSETLNRDTTVEIPWLASATKLSFGARHNAANGYGPCRIRNVLVRQKVIKTDIADDDGEIEGATIESNP